MPKPDAALLDPARYPYHCLIETRFGDLDTNQHINNVALVGVLEEARVRFHRASGSHAALQGLTTMVASLSVEFLAQGHYPDPLETHVGVAGLGRTSYTLHQLVRQQGRVVCYAVSVLVCMGPAGPTPLDDSFRASVAPSMLRA